MSELPLDQYYKARVAFIVFCKEHGIDSMENPLRTVFLQPMTENAWLLWTDAWLAAIKHNV